MAAAAAAAAGGGGGGETDASAAAKSAAVAAEFFSSLDAVPVVASGSLHQLFTPAQMQVRVSGESRCWFWSTVQCDMSHMTVVETALFCNRLFLT